MMKIKKIHIYLTLVLLTFGFMISYSIQFTKKTPHSPITASQWEKKQQLQEKIIAEQLQVQQLEEQLQQIKESVSEFESKMGDSQEQTKGVMQELEEVRMWVGLMPAKGPGLIATLTDSSNVPSSGNANDFIVHDDDIRKVVNELFAAGAEAISVNGQRLTANSAIYCVGPTVLVNEVKMAPPFEIFAIGQPETLYSALNMPGGVAQEIKEGSNIEMKVDKKENVEIPAYAGDSQEHLKLLDIREGGS
ncbi:hypothetical protein BEP19_06760 [Ammoniphilus oxalaticus]|uniref:DUF881 domain-containing protein n=1 Tax=Ammoniphilus oxalaticus TaxID=66863 RepID=A0A419SJ87_9BACL|nr:DUF881 domain-containing protein [Ammoniphilus oxalaticus]RKD24104.1 hypothetical protein BEP19_06760 [Ammoniphilus oxalaticus]